MARVDARGELPARQLFGLSDLMRETMTSGEESFNAGRRSRYVTIHLLRDHRGLGWWRAKEVVPPVNAGF